jgi:site-specific recombinase XerD
MPNTKKALIIWKEHLNFKRKRDNISEIQSDYVFCRINGERIKSFRKSWQSVLYEAGIKDFHFHDLRHTFCSNLLLSGASLKDVKEMMGNSDISMTDRYSHLTINHKHDMQNQLAIHYSNHN